MRADKFFATKYGSRTKAADSLKRGLILKNGKPLSPDDEVQDDSDISFLNPEKQFVSNGGYKLSHALDVFQLDIQGMTFADLGTSTGGFCDCLLQRGAGHVFCVDVGENQLDESLKGEKVTVMDRTNARFLTAKNFPLKIHAVSADLSFISLRLILPAIFEILNGEGSAFVLFKPQFECGERVNKSGIVPIIKHSSLLRDFYGFTLKCNLFPVDIAAAPIRPKKNVEYVIWLKTNCKPITIDEFLRRAALSVK